MTNAENHGMHGLQGFYPSLRKEVNEMHKFVSYDLHNPERNYDSIISAISKYPCCKINQSDWVIYTADSCSNVRNNLIKHLDYNDSLFVAKLSTGSDWWASYNINRSAVSWLNC